MYQADPELIQLHSRTLAGTILIAYGIIKIIGYFSKDLYCLAFQYDFACGIFLIVLGITTLCISSRFKDSSLLAALGILILLDSLLSIQTALDSKKFGLSSWKYILLFSMITGTFGVLVVLKVQSHLQVVHFCQKAVCDITLFSILHDYLITII